MNKEEGEMASMRKDAYVNFLKLCMKLAKPGIRVDEGLATIRSENGGHKA
jgi:hypothetical protein